MDLKRNLLFTAMALTLLTVHTVPAFAAAPVEGTHASEDGGASLYTYKYIVVGNDVRVRATPGQKNQVRSDNDTSYHRFACHDARL